MNRLVYHPLNLTLRFLLELGALAAMAVYGWRLSSVFPWNLVASVSIPATAMILWGLFAVPDDRSRSGNAPIPIPGLLRLTLELAFFSFSIWCLVAMDKPVQGLILGGAVVLHYGLSIERITWLLSNRDNTL